MCRRNHLGEVKNCKEIKGESVSAQHRVMDCEVKCTKRGKQLLTPKIKWWKLKEEHLTVEFNNEVMREVTLKENANEWWKENSKIIRKVAEEVLGKPSGKGIPQGKDTWW